MPPVLVREDVRFEDVLEGLTLHDRAFDEEFLKSVYEFSRETHGDQVRRSGKPYFTHPLNVAYILALAGLALFMMGAGDNIYDENSGDFKMSGIGVALFVSGFILYQYVKD